MTRESESKPPDPDSTRLHADGTRLHQRSAPAMTAFRSASSPPDAPMTRLRSDPDVRSQLAGLELQEGSVIKGRFELKTLVGRGGMGMVWSALDRRKMEARDPNPEVAVKILNATFQQHPDAFIALQREACKAQTLAHPNIATVFDFDREGENVFITMELLRGKSLEEVIHGVRNRGVGRKAALPMIRGIAEGLGYAHRKGIVHSDLKPANIFVVEDGTPKLLDFGIARAVPTTNAVSRDQFDAGSLGAYTEAYATEEMVQGADPSPADDIYALGIVVYELLAGKHPFAGKTSTQARAAGSSPAPIKALSRREWRTLSGALAFDRAKRPADATEFVRLFFGATRLRNAAIAAILALAMVSGYLWIRNYQQTGPAVPFEQLPAATQQQIKMDFDEGGKAWAFYAQAGIANALNDSLSYFADAYKLHKGNRQAASGLRRAADEILKRARNDPQSLRETARTLAETSDFLKTYPPVADALGP
jgi:protein kinase-like protein